MITTNQINYVAGILEGEGSFGITNSSVSIVLGMTDEDVVKKVRNIINPDAQVFKYGYDDYKRPNSKDFYRLNVNGIKAVQWMMTIYSLMGDRRKSKIKEILSTWKSNLRPNYVQGACRYGHPTNIINKDYKLTDRGVKICLHCRRKQDFRRTARAS